MLQITVSTNQLPAEHSKHLQLDQQRFAKIRPLQTMADHYHVLILQQQIHKLQQFQQVLLRLQFHHQASHSRGFLQLIMLLKQMRFAMMCMVQQLHVMLTVQLDIVVV
jgi:hypothetical protein